MQIEEYCADCAAPRGPLDYICRQCGGDVWTETLPGDLVAKMAPSDAARSAVVGFLAGRLHVAPGTVALFAGPPGAGKSTLALQTFARPWYATSEMSLRQVGQYANRIGAELAGVGPVWEGVDIDGDPVVHFPDAVPEHLEDQAPDLVIDSVNGCRFPLEVLAAAQAYTKEHDARAILVAHYTKRNEIRGSVDLPHLVDHVVRMEPEGGHLRLRVAKTRGGPTWSGPYELTARGVRPPGRRGYYSVEGPPYKLVRHPSRRAQFADYLRKAEKRPELRAHLPPPPCAVTAQASSLYPGGWTEPEDLEQRRAVCEAEGLRHWSPLEVLEELAPGTDVPNEERGPDAAA